MVKSQEAIVGITWQLYFTHATYLSWRLLMFELV